MLDNHMVTGEEYPSYLHAEEPVKCNAFVLVGGYWNPHTEPCSEPGVPGTETHSCPTHGFEECRVWFAQLLEDGGSDAEWAALHDNVKKYREAAAR